MSGNLMIIDNTLIGYRGDDKIVEIPKGIVKIDERAFRIFNHVEKVIIPDTVEEICDEAFLQMNALKELLIPKSVAKIGENICGRCTALTSIGVSEDNPVYASFGSNCIIEKTTGTLIQGCAETIIPNTVKALAPRCFWKHHKLEKITIPDSVVSIGKEAFYETNLSSLYISKNVESINPSAFLGNYGLKSIMVDKENCSYRDDGSDAIVLTDGDVMLLAGAEGLVPRTVREIGFRSEDDCDVPECYPFFNAAEVVNITIPKTVQYINWRAFDNCGALQSISYAGTKEEFGSLFTRIPSLSVEIHCVK